MAFKAVSVGARYVKFAETCPWFISPNNAGFSDTKPSSAEKEETFRPPKAPVNGCCGNFKKL